jgi:hypothetical protein
MDRSSYLNILQLIWHPDGSTFKKPVFISKRMDAGHLVIHRI